MTDKERFDACMKQADFFYRKVYNRQAYQWKVTLGLWTFLAITVNFLWGKGIKIPFWCGPLILAFYGFFWLRAMAVRNRDDQRAAYHFSDQAKMILAGGSSDGGSTPARMTFRCFYWWLGFLCDAMHLFEFVTTAILIIAAYKVLN